MSDIYFSVVIPSYNQREFLKQAINSVFNQRYKLFEIIVIDNKSNDGTQEYIKSLKSNKIRFIINENFGSISISRNIGIEESKGNWISFLDSDDYWHPDKLLIINEKIKKENYDIVSHNEYFINKNNEILSYREYGSKKKDSLKELIKRNLYSTSAISIKGEFLKRNKLFFDERLIFATAEDYDFWIRLTIKKARILNIKKGLGYYRIHENSASKKAIKHLNAVLAVKKKNILYIAENNLLKTMDLIEIILHYFFYRFYKISSENLKKFFIR